MERNGSSRMGRNSFYILSFGFTFSTLNFKFSSTSVEGSLQISPFLTNKANSRKSQMNVSGLLTRDYGKMDTWSSGKNKAKTNPIQTQFKPNSNPIQTQFKPNTKPISRAKECCWQSFTIHCLTFVLPLCTVKSEDYGRTKDIKSTCKRG